MPRIPSRLATLLLAAFLGACATNPMPPDVAARIREIGPVINPPETAKLYAPLQSPLSAAQAAVERDIAYGADPRHRLDVVKPLRAGAPLPVLVFVHGGGFVAGNKTAPGSPFYDSVMAWAVRHGMVGVNLTYRLAPAHPWPAGRDDLAQALQWVGANIAARGGDPRRVFVFGHSAGATHVASVLADEATRQKIAQAGTTLAGGILLSGVYDLSIFPAAPSPKAYFGDDASRYAQRSPLAGLVSGDIPLLVGNAELDPPEFRVQFKSLVEPMCQRGRCPQRLDLAGHSHMSEIYSLGTDDRRLSDAIAAFVAARM